MNILTKTAEIREIRSSWHEKGLRIGFVPTMGALHQGHLSLVQQSKQENDITIVSIFVNPTQFNESSDFVNYPRTEDADIELLKAVNPEVIFIPLATEMYPEPNHSIELDLEGLDRVMEGKFRQGHFAGVVTIVDKFFDLIQPDRAYFGQKDFQQLQIIRLLATKRYPQTSIIACPIIREPDGLAMSSRNARLTADQRERSLVISQALFHLESRWKKATISELTEEAKSLFLSSGLELEYFEVVDPLSLNPVYEYTGSSLVACVAARVGEIRLIDNISLPA